MASHLLLVDESDAARRLRAALEQRGFQVSVVDAPTDALGAIERRAPDTVVWATNGQGPPAGETIGRLRRHTPAPVLVVVRGSEPSHRVQVLDAGADDVVDEPVDADELRARIDAVLRRNGLPAAESASVVAVDGLALDLDDRVVTVEGAEVGLTPTEWRLLEVIVRGGGSLVTYEEIIRHVWSPQHGDEARDSLRAHLRALRRKLGDDPAAPRFIATEPGHGCRWLAAG